MLSPAQRHMMRVSAAEASQRENDPLRQATGYEQMLFRLAADKRTLKQVRSIERKAEMKNVLLPGYAPWVAGVLASGRGAQDAVLMTVMVWKLDAGDIPGALEIARYALQHKLVMPEGYTRPTPYLLAEDVADAATRAHTAGQTVNIELLIDTLTLTDAEDMPDQVRAKLHKIIGLILRGGKPEQALFHLKRAFQLDSRSGVKKDIERLETALRKAAANR
ncbi:terminase endonuclease subunit [Pectobacterium carotovorum]|uniref:phage terminase small subunit n=1 Tax=Pectobacterium carotovorum TaxID=554 RepID=UPI00191CF8F8|nr:terminase endonuclease subunit [Pectobacterium carotovorum]MBL0909100.1 terminase endonuclease subunit [Pectobacterium carotovorum]